MSSYLRKFRVIIVLIAIYALLVLAVMLFQRHFIYLPSCFPETVALNIAKQEQLQPWRSTDGKLIGWQLPASRPALSSVLVVHGNAGSALNRTYFAQPIHEAEAFDVFILEYPGYGARDGKPSLNTLLAAAEEAFRLLPTNQPIYLVAESLGTGVAAHLARRFPEAVRGMALFVPYDKFSSVAQNAMPWLPAGLLLRDRYAPAEWLREYRGPVTFVLAEQDTIIPVRFGRRLYESYAGPKNLTIVPGAGHNDIAAQSAQWWKETAKFWWAEKSH